MTCVGGVSLYACDSMATRLRSRSTDSPAGRPDLTPQGDPAGLLRFLASDWGCSRQKRDVWRSRRLPTPPPPTAGWPLS